MKSYTRDVSATLHRTTVDIEVDAYEEARRLLGTRGYRDTVNGALREVARIAALRHAADLIRKGGLNLATPEDIEAMRRPRYDFDSDIPR
jgi:Arc/MetJ family transcription regulator